MDADLRELAERTMQKVGALTEAEYAELAVYAADEVWPGIGGWHRRKAAG